MIRKLPLRTRLTLLIAVAVTVAVTGVAAIAWFATRTNLYNQVDQSIAGTSLPPPPHGGATLASLCGPQGGGFDGGVNTNQNNSGADTGNGATTYHPLPLTHVEYVSSSGDTCTLGQSVGVVITPADLQIATTPHGELWRFGTSTDGQRVRIQVLSTPEPGIAIVKSQPVDGIDNSLTDLAWLLLAVAGIGIAAAASAGLVIARASLRPVDRLTEAVEHVARTEDLTVRIPVDGDDEIARLSRSFNAMTAALYASRDEQKRLIDDAGHELRTPLTSLRTTIDLLIRSDETGRPLPGDTRTKLLTGARTQMRELTVLIADLLELSRPEQSRDETSSLGPVDLHDIVERAVERVRPRGTARAEPVEISEVLSPWYTRGDAAGLERAIVNLLDNAVKFSPGDGVVDVLLKDGELTVRDRGPGIDAADLPHVFERFWRSTSARALPGSGLGLAIAARVVREAGGTVSLGPADDGPGTVARIKLPGSALPGVASA